MSTMRLGLAFAMVALLVTACGAQQTPPAASSLSTAVALGTPSVDPTASPAASATPVPRDLAIYPLPQADHLLVGAAVASMASGPAGVVILGSDRATGALASWTSSDGDGWVRHWLPGDSFGGGTPDLVVGAPFGYLAVGWRTDAVSRAFVEGISFPRAMWSSSDGIAWATASESGLPVGEVTGLVSGPAGVAALITIDGSHSATAVTQDGRSWQRPR